MTHDSFLVSEEVFGEFTEDTGITVILLQAGDAGAMVNRAILTKDHPLADVLYGVDNTFLSLALSEELFIPYRSTEIDHVPTELRDPEDRVTPIDFGDVCLNTDIAGNSLLSPRPSAPRRDHRRTPRRAERWRRTRRSVGSPLRMPPRTRDCMRPPIPE